MKCLFVYLFNNLLINFYSFFIISIHIIFSNACYCICYFSGFPNIDCLKAAHFVFCKCGLLISKCETVCCDIYKVIFLAEFELI